MTASCSSLHLEHLLAAVPLPAPVCPAAAAEAVSDGPEGRWIREAQAGCPRAFGLLVEAHQDAVHGFCRQWLACENDAIDACQDTFLRAWQALPAWEPRARFRTWLYQIALNRCRDLLRSRAHRQKKHTVPLSEMTTAPPCGQPSPDAAAAHRSDMERLRLGLSCLPDSLREPLVLCAIQGLSQQEAGLVLGCSARAVEGRLYRARQQLLEWWNRQP